MLSFPINQCTDGPAWRHVYRLLLIILDKDLDGAVEDYSRAIVVDPAYATAYASRAVVRTLQGKNAEAVGDFESAFRLDPALRETFGEFAEKRLGMKPPNQ